MYNQTRRLSTPLLLRTMADGPLTVDRGRWTMDRWTISFPSSLRSPLPYPVQQDTEVFFVPGTFVFEDSAQNTEQFAHGSNHGNFEGFTSFLQALKEGTDDRIEARGR